jgi:uncharacterized protein
MTTSEIQSDVDQILASVEPLPRQRAWPALVVLVGAPGCGKSTVAAALSERTPLVVLCSDDVREALVDEAGHSFAETQRVTRAMRSAAAELLSQRITVLLDATNLTEWERAPLYTLAEQQSARLILVEVTAPMEVVIERLRERHERPDAREPGRAADIYHRMAGRREPIAREHHTVDTSTDIASFIDGLAMDLDEG